MPSSSCPPVLPREEDCWDCDGGHIGLKDSLLLLLNHNCYPPHPPDCPANQIRSFFETHTKAECEEKIISMSLDMLTSNKNETHSPQARGLLSTLAVAMCSQHASDVEKLQQELTSVQRDVQDFKQEVSTRICKIEGTLRDVMKVVKRLETSSHHVEQRLREEEDRGIVRNKVLTFLLPREKELQGKCADLERRLCRNNVSLFHTLSQKAEAKEIPSSSSARTLIDHIQGIKCITSCLAQANKRPGSALSHSVSKKTLIHGPITSTASSALQKTEHLGAHQLIQHYRKHQHQGNQAEMIARHFHSTEV